MKRKNWQNETGASAPLRREGVNKTISLFDRACRLKTEAGSVEKAIQGCRSLAEQNHAPSLYRLGSLHQDGNHVGKDEALSFSCFTRTAELDLAESHYKRGLMLFYGQGVRRDTGKGLFHLAIAARKGVEQAEQKWRWIMALEGISWFRTSSLSSHHGA